MPDVKNTPSVSSMLLPWTVASLWAPCSLCALCTLLVAATTGVPILAFGSDTVPPPTQEKAASQGDPKAEEKKESPKDAQTPPESDAGAKKETPPADTKSGSSAPAEAKAAVKPAVKAEATPMPRYIHLPAVELQTISANSEGALEKLTYDFSRKRFSLVFVFGSWNRRSQEIAVKINERMGFFDERHIGVVGVFSHDTKISLQKWQKDVGPRFLIGLAANDFIERLRNPKVPTLWLVNNRGEIMHRSELPTNKELDGLFSKVTLWTDF